MATDASDILTEAREAALQVLLHNAHGPFRGLPRTAGWGYPEPYTRDLMIAALGYATSGHPKLMDAFKRTLEALARNLSPRGHVPSLAHDPDNRGASDTTPLFLFGVGVYRQATGQADAFDDAAQLALNWMRYQSPDDCVMVGQLPTSDWRDEHWVLGYGLFVNTVYYTALRMFEQHDDADKLHGLMNRFEITQDSKPPHVHEGLVVPKKPYYALYSYKTEHNERFDLLGNSWAVLSGVASPTRADRLITWVEGECDLMRERGELAVNLPPCLFPYMQVDDSDWRPRYAKFNRAGEYHNGGVWPFICGFYVASAVAAKRTRLAKKKLEALAHLVKPWHEDQADWGFNEQIKAQTGKTIGRDWQTWSAAMYLYADACVSRDSTPFFDDVRNEAGSIG